MRNDDVNFKGILAFLGLLVLALAGVYLVITTMWRALERHARKNDEQTMRQAPSLAAASTRPYFPAPREQPVPLADLETLRAREEAELNSYGWIDKTSGLVRMPIDRAIELLSQQTQQTKGQP
jgi:hypothetical protein